MPSKYLKYRFYNIKTGKTIAHFSIGKSRKYRPFVLSEKKMEISQRKRIELDVIDFEIDQNFK